MAFSQGNKIAHYKSDLDKCHEVLPWLVSALMSPNPGLMLWMLSKLMPGNVSLVKRH